MHQRTIVWLVLVVLALAGAAWWQLARERAAQRGVDVLLFEGVDPARVVAIEVENIERDTRMRLERDALGAWRMTDPMDAPAHNALANELLESALTRRGTLAPEGEDDPEKLGLSPPRIVLEIEERIDGKPHESRVEVGLLDADGNRVHVRTRGMILRTLRDLDTAVAQPLDSFKTRDAIDMRPQEVVEFHRRGRFRFEDEIEARDVSLDIVGERGRWRATSPVSAALDPLAVSFVIQGATRLEIVRYLESENLLPADYGLDPEELRVELVPVEGATQAVRFGRVKHDPTAPWNGTREGQRFVWALESTSVRLLATPLEDLLDHRLFRAARDRIDSVTLRCGGRELLITRDARSWRGQSVASTNPSATMSVPLDQGRVEDLLVRLERAELAGFRLDEDSLSGAAADGIWVRTGDEVEGGRLGAEFVSDDGTRTRRFQRDGDGVVGLLDVSVADIACTPPEMLWSLRLWTLTEVEQSELSLSGGGKARRFVRDSKGLWMESGTSTEARALRELLDPLLFLAAAEHVAPGTSGELQDPLTVAFTGADGEVRTFVIGHVPENLSGAARDEIEIDGRRAIPRDAGLYARIHRVLES